MVSAVTIMSRWASELWAKKTGYRAVQTTAATATGTLATRVPRRNNPASAAAETSSMALRVTT